MSQRDEFVIERVRSAASAHLGIDLRDAQIQAGTHLLTRSIAEMPTGEGKTLTTVIPAAVMAMRRDRRNGLHVGQRGCNVLVATANDYLAARDAQWMEPIYRELDLRVGSVSGDSTVDQRRQAYQCDVIYGTIRQFAFDYLRQSLAGRHKSTDEGGLPFSLEALIVDEADSALIDEARTPMIITVSGRSADAANSAAGPEMDRATEACYRWSARQAGEMRIDDDFVRLAGASAVALTERGRDRAIRSEMPSEMGSLSTTDILHALERAVWVNESIHRDKHYVVKDGRIHIIDEYTGRKAGERNFGGGIHQAIEAREALRLTPESEPVARISVQDFAILFGHLCGLTATAWEDRQELKAVYGLSVRRFATHVPSRRTVLEPVVCRSREEKWKQILDETRSVKAAGRAVLIGTRTIQQSEQLSDRFRRSGIEHVVLNARNAKQEAEIVVRAGQSGRVTIATNMAGRGTDIHLDPCVARAGGLHVIVSEPHAASRIDRQLIGRCGRQGDPGTARLYASPDDEIVVQAFGDERAERIRRAAERGAGDRWLLAKLKQAQRRVARNHRTERARLTAHEANLAQSMQLLGLDPHLDPLPEVR